LPDDACDDEYELRCGGGNGVEDDDDEENDGYATQGRPTGMAGIERTREALVARQRRR
jgi:hypothetical protein